MVCLFTACNKPRITCSFDPLKTNDMFKTFFNRLSAHLSDDVHYFFECKHCAQGYFGASYLWRRWLSSSDLFFVILRWLRALKGVYTNEALLATLISVYCLLKTSVSTGYARSFIQYSVWRQVQSLFQNDSST